MDVSSFYQAPMASLGALIYIFYQQKILRLSLVVQIAVISVKIFIQIILGALAIWIFYGAEFIYWTSLIKSAVIMQIVCAGAQIMWKAYKK